MGEDTKHLLEEDTYGVGPRALLSRPRVCCACRILVVMMSVTMVQGICHGGGVVVPLKSFGGHGIVWVTILGGLDDSHVLCCQSGSSQFSK